MNKEKVKIMTNLAIYEKNLGKDDFTVNNFFKSNYISYNNFKTRLGVAIAMCIIFAGDLMRRITKDINNITEIDYVSIGIRYLIILAIVLTIYTILSTFIYKKRYKNAETRIEKYKKLINKLDSYK
ncbi:MAG: hypothetical protein N4A63_07555 [Vallitalea sp.]|nr:hypothetical protein [Vallitalea sp.]